MSEKKSAWESWVEDGVMRSPVGGKDCSCGTNDWTISLVDAVEKDGRRIKNMEFRCMGCRKVFVLKNVYPQSVSTNDLDPEVVLVEEVMLGHDHSSDDIKVEQLNFVLPGKFIGEKIEFNGPSWKKIIEWHKEITRKVEKPKK
jgi:transposase-like protein